MRILLISARYLPHRGGLESVTHHLAQEFCRQGHTVQIVTRRYPRALPATEEMDGVQVTRLHFLLPDWTYLLRFRFDLWLAGLWYRFYDTRALRRTINDFQPDIINNHYLNEVADFTGRCVAKLSVAIPWVVSLHGGDVDGEPLFSRISKERFSRLSRQANGLTACSNFLAIQARTLEPALQGKIEVIHNGVDAKGFANAKPYPADHPYIFAVGQLASHKGFDLLIQAFAQVAGKYPNVQLWIAGDGSQRTALETLIQQKKLVERVQLLGRVNEVMVASLMAGCSFVAMPSHREPFGIVALEAMAAGKCVLATPVGGIPEFLPCPPNRMVVPEQSAWSNALDEWLALAMSGQLMANGNIQEALKRDWSNVARQYLQIFDQVIHHV
ncbi:MAG: glycosyltransferase family 4 protein [Chloroflexota bacterium]